MDKKLLEMLKKSISNNIENKGLDIELSKGFNKDFFNVDKEAKENNIRTYIKSNYLDEYMFLHTFLDMLKKDEVEINFKENASEKSLAYLNKLKK